jgi:hypothetical protein
MASFGWLRVVRPIRRLSVLTVTREAELVQQAEGDRCLSPHCAIAPVWRFDEGLNSKAISRSLTHCDRRPSST